MHSKSSQCEKCGGAAEPAARMKSFECLGQTVHCLQLISSCVVCGHQWEDNAYGHENERFEQQACASVLGRIENTREPLGAAVRR
jgi:hypothetical protein